MGLPSLIDRKRGRGLAAVAGLMLLQGAAAGAAAFATRALFDAMHDGGDLPTVGLAILIAAGAMIAATRIAARAVGERIGQDYAHQVRAALFEHAARMPARAVAERRAGYTALRFVGDMTAFRNWIGLSVPRLIAGAILIPTMLVILFLLNPVFAVVVLPVFVVTLGGSFLGGLRLVDLHRRLRRYRARIAADMAERMPLAPQLDRLGRRGKELALLEKRTDAMIRAALRHRVTAEMLRSLPDLAGGLAAALMILAGHRQGLSPASLAAALATLGLLLAPLRDLGGVWNHHAAYRAAALKVELALSRQTRDLYRAGHGLGKGPVDVTFEDVALPTGERLDLRIKGGAQVCLPVGELDGYAITDILLGLDSPSSGRVLLSGVDVRNLSRGSLRRGVLRVGSDPEILHGSLRRVLVMGSTDRTDDAALEAIAHSVGLGPLMDRLGGLGGTVREGGTNLTRTERVSICVARLYLVRPRLILLDQDCDEMSRGRIAQYLQTRSATVIDQTVQPGLITSAA